MVQQIIYNNNAVAQPKKDDSVARARGERERMRR